MLAYSVHVADILKARERARKIYGIETVTRNWLERILELSQAKPSPLPAYDREFFGEVDVVIWNETHRDAAIGTLRA